MKATSCINGPNDDIELASNSKKLDWEVELGIVIGKETKNIESSDIILLGVSRTSKTPTSIYLANRGYRTSNIPIIPNKNLPKQILENEKKNCINFWYYWTRRILLS